MQPKTVRICVGVSCLILGTVGLLAFDLDEIQYPYKTFFALSVMGLLGYGVFSIGRALTDQKKRYRWQ